MGLAKRLRLAALEQQTLPRSEYQVLVVDDSALRSGPAAARNRGWRRAEGPIVAFTDDDTEPRPDWLEQGLRAMQDADAASAASCSSGWAASTRTSARPGSGSSPR